MATENPGLIGGFKEFISRGNAIDLAVGMVIGAAFTAIVNSLVQKVLNPLVAGLVGKPNFDKVLAFQIGGAEVMPGAVITQIVNFLLVALALYLFVIVPINKMHRLAEEKKALLLAKEQAEAEEKLVVSAEEQQTELLQQIRDLLQNQQMTR